MRQLMPIKEITTITHITLIREITTDRTRMRPRLLGDFGFRRCTPKSSEERTASQRAFLSIFPTVPKQAQIVAVCPFRGGEILRIGEVVNSPNHRVARLFFDTFVDHRNLCPGDGFPGLRNESGSSFRNEQKIFRVMIRDGDRQKPTWKYIGDG
jgi:hypothetical protein